jgi:hypothetical protein
MGGERRGRRHAAGILFHGVLLQVVGGGGARHDDESSLRICCGDSSRVVVTRFLPFSFKKAAKSAPAFASMAG